MGQLGPWLGQWLSPVFFQKRWEGGSGGLLLGWVSTFYFPGHLQMLEDLPPPRRGPGSGCGQELVASARHY